MSKVKVNRQAKKSDMVKRLNLCIKTYSVNAALKLFTRCTGVNVLVNVDKALIV